ncbi:UrcA family protein [Maricaulis maris]|uniref:UrcA family protein n=1 Tax=Maricaulis maris TaxID=74318 RepID=A0A495DLT9_9PROT|nr:UrcA family protein [Maricaulis maris]RKR03887.1 UrcA family protein [Maricaulis maris]
MKHTLLTLAVCLTGLTAALSGTGGTATAQTPAGPAVQIPFEAADLIDPTRYEALRERVEIAARDVCREQLLGDLLRPVTLNACIRDAHARAIDQLEAQRSTALTVAAASVPDQG